jgi:Cu/Ag efflux pump CusA
MDYPPLGGQPLSGDDGRAVSQHLGAWTIVHTPVDALPDLSDVQVIVKTSYPGQAPQIVENQVTWPLTTTMLSVPAPKRYAASRSLATPMST